MFSILAAVSMPSLIMAVQLNFQLYDSYKVYDIIDVKSLDAIYPVLQSIEKELGPALALRPHIANLRTFGRSLNTVNTGSNHSKKVSAKSFLTKPDSENLFSNDLAVKSPWAPLSSSSQGELENGAQGDFTWKIRFQILKPSESMAEKQVSTGQENQSSEKKDRIRLSLQLAEGQNLPIVDAERDRDLNIVFRVDFLKKGNKISQDNISIQLSSKQIHELCKGVRQKTIIELRAWPWADTIVVSAHYVYISSNFGTSNTSDRNLSKTNVFQFYPHETAHLYYNHNKVEGGEGKVIKLTSDPLVAKLPKLTEIHTALDLKSAAVYTYENLVVEFSATNANKQVTVTPPHPLVLTPLPLVLSLNPYESRMTVRFSQTHPDPNYFRSIFMKNLKGHDNDFKFKVEAKDDGISSWTYYFTFSFHKSCDMTRRSVVEKLVLVVDSYTDVTENSDGSSTSREKRKSKRVRQYLDDFEISLDLPREANRLMVSAWYQKSRTLKRLCQLGEEAVPNYSQKQIPYLLPMPSQFDEGSICSVGALSFREWRQWQEMLKQQQEEMMTMFYNFNTWHSNAFLQPHDMECKPNFETYDHYDSNNVPQSPRVQPKYCPSDGNTYTVMESLDAARNPREKLSILDTRSTTDAGSPRTEMSSEGDGCENLFAWDPPN